MRVADRNNKKIHRSTEEVSGKKGKTK